MKCKADAPIGIFDSGIGGLTVARAVKKELPNENIIYFGDTARVPYGIKSEKTIQEYALQITEFLMQKQVKMVLVACNSVSASALPKIYENVEDQEVLDVISAGVEAAAADKPLHVGVIGTLATISSGAYEHELKKLIPEAKIQTTACPLLVPLAEEGWIENEIAQRTLNIYLAPYRKDTPDCLILGCTHYPLFKSSIKEVLNSPQIQIVDSGWAIARTTHRSLKERNLLNKQEEKGFFSCYVSDKPQRFHNLAERFLGQTLPEVHVTSLS